MKRKKRARSKLSSLVIVLVFLLLIGFSAFIILLGSGEGGDGVESSIPQESSVSADTKESKEKSDSSASSIPASEAQSLEESKPQSKLQSSQVASRVVSQNSVQSSTYSQFGSNSFPNQVQFSAEVDDSYFDETIIVGDSIIDGLAGFGLISRNNIIAYPGINPDNVMTKKWIKIDGMQYTVPEALTFKNSENVKRIYIMLGTNGIAWISPQTMAEKMFVFVNEVREIHPQADIYILSIPPVDTAKQSTHNISNEAIDSYNKMLYNNCLERSIPFINTNEALRDQNGSLSAEISEKDGTHFKVGGYKILFDYLKTHTE